MADTAEPGTKRDEHTMALWWQDWLVAISQLTIFRPEIEPPPDAADLGRARRAYPLVALLIGLLTITFYGLGRSFGLFDFGAVTLALAMLILLTGARGEIGLGIYVETVSRGRTPEAIQEWSARGPVGYAGMLAILISVVFRIAAFSSILAGQPAVLIAVIIGSRTAMALAPAFRPRDSAGDESLRVGNDWLWLAAALGAAFLLLFLGPIGGLIACLVGLVVMRMTVGLARRQLRTFGAPAYAMIQQVTEIALLLSAVALP
jgi:adenosylcobinamide-GDP ribazoletransferase